MLKCVLIANRGEIASRIIRTAKRMGLRAIAVYSQADREAPHVRQADAAYFIGPAPARESYLRADRILEAALAAGADCVHPGYGFLSENAEFAEACAAAGLVFIGPSPAAIRAMGLKDGAKALMARAGVPVVPGYHGAEQDADFLAARAAETGWPVLIKAVAGGGGKGMRRVDAPGDFAGALESARREALAAFGDGRVLIEKYVSAPRHIEVQVFGDSHGGAVHLFERDCSLQRRHQKVMEEAPAPGMSAAMRGAMCGAAVEAAKAVGYAGAGTVEFIAEGGAELTGNFWFMEMNTRLQVEHPVTEAVTGIDLVEWQFRIAAGERLPLRQEDIRVSGHAVEARLYAEDPENGFLPSTGKLWALRFPQGEGVRVDAGAAEGDEVTPFYDPMIAKIIAHGATRDEALDRLAGALGRMLAAGPRCNTAFLKALCQAEDFRAGNFDTGFIGGHLEALGAVKQGVDEGAVMLGAVVEVMRKSMGIKGAAGDPWSDADAFQFSGARRTIEPLIVNGAPAQAPVEWIYGNAVAGSGPARTSAERAGSFWRGADSALTAVETDSGTLVLRAGRQTSVRLAGLERGAGDDAEDQGAAARSPMHGRLVSLLVKTGDAVVRGQRVAIVEAMKMEHALTAPCAGRVAGISAAEGAQVAQGAVIVTIEPDTGDKT